MRLSSKNLSLLFTAGALGGLANSLCVWGLGALGLPLALGVKLAPALSAPWLYQRLVWGGLWSVLFLLPQPRWPYEVRGLFFSLGPSLATFFLVLPLQAHKGLFGFQLGALTPLFVLFYNAVWGVVAGLWLRLTEKAA
jgi:hypothetical protein